MSCGQALTLDPPALVYPETRFLQPSGIGVTLSGSTAKGRGVCELFCGAQQAKGFKKLFDLGEKSGI
jgi:hypothetical protein